MTAAPADPTVLNTTVLSNFAHVDCAELLVELPRVVTVPAVRDELAEGVETHAYLDNALAIVGDDIPVVTPSESACELEAELLETLDPGEAQSLAVATAADGTIVTDDGDARTAAEQHGTTLTGSIGLLVRFVDDGTLSAETADSYLKHWIDAGGFHSPARDFRRFLEE